ncbi:ABC transporter ATP-binding protein [Numidum massiliense]|uniref:ABC transporter ATP-binding protein n=1 Tax=Numidum massiliense TaxID=1522315 RepID=UPI000B2B7B4F|nr:ABC transporter ATP-binding protein [Numidum massiliense]
METVLHVNRLTKAYGSKRALTDVTFSVRRGSCVGLLGPNGAGKSTTMKIVTGIVDADSGTANVLGFDSEKQRRHISRKIGYVPQAIALYEKITAYDNLIFFGEMYGMSGKELKARIDDVLQFTGLADRAKQPVRNFSGGMKRRINIAAALLHRPELLILDEPTVGIDPQSRNLIFDMIRKLQTEGVTIVYSTHYMEEVEALCDEIAIIDSGSVIAQGALHELLERYGENAIYFEADDLEAGNMEQLPQFRAVTKATAQGRGWKLESDAVQETMQHVMRTAIERKFTVKRLEVVRPSLETVFLNLTGTSLRDE